MSYIDEHRHQLCPPHVAEYKRKDSTHRTCINCGLSEEYIREALHESCIALPYREEEPTTTFGRLWSGIRRVI